MRCLERLRTDLGLLLAAAGIVSTVFFFGGGFLRGAPARGGGGLCSGAVTQRRGRRGAAGARHSQASSLQRRRCFSRRPRSISARPRGATSCRVLTEVPNCSGIAPAAVAGKWEKDVTKCAENPWRSKKRVITLPGPRALPRDPTGPAPSKAAALTTRGRAASHPHQKLVVDTSPYAPSAAQGNQKSISPP